VGVIASALRMVFPKYPSRLTLIGRLGDERDYQWFVGDGSASPLVDSILSFIIHGFTQMYPVVAVSAPNEIDSTEIQAAHPAAVLFRRPSYDPDLGRSWLSWMELIAGVIVSYRVDGNAYIIKVRSAAGRTVQLWYTPHFMLEPRWDLNDPTRFITHYDYAPSGVRLTDGPMSIASPDGPVYPIRVQDVIHLRDGLDPQNPRKGYSKVKKILREIFTDEEAARWTASLLRNQGVPGLVISPTSDKGWITDKNDAEESKERLRAMFSGDRRGEPIIMRGPSKVEHFGFSPEAMKLREIRAIPEERIAAQLGVPAAVVGFGAGLEHTKVGRTMEEFVDLAWQNGILPPARMIAPQLTEQFLSEWEPDGAGVTHDFTFDTSRVPIMASYHKIQAERHEILVRGSIETRAEARRALGLRPGVRDHVYVLQAGTVEVPSDKTIADAPALALAPAPAQLALPAPSASTSADEEQVPLADVVAKSLDLHQVGMERAFEATRALARATVEGAREQASAVLELAARFATKSAEPPPPAEIHLHIDEGAFKIDATTHVDPGAVVIQKGAVQVAPKIDARTSVEPGAVQIDHHTHLDAANQGGDIEIVRGGDGRVAAVRRVVKSGD
jgi:phage portal protein BeeE